MWLDRLSGHSTPGVTPSASPPPPANRSYSPAARRPSHLAPTSAPHRPSFSPRSSSLSLNSNDSTTSLLASSRRPNGSSLKQSVTVADAPDPLKVLERLLGSEANRVPSKSEFGADGTKCSTEGASEGELDFEGLSLRALASDEGSSSKEAHSYTTQTIDECMIASRFSTRANVRCQMNETRTNLRTSIGPSAPATTCSTRSKSI
jgi:vacuolar protein sorting-associated protein 52